MMLQQPLSPARHLQNRRQMWHRVAATKLSLSSISSLILARLTNALASKTLSQPPSNVRLVEVREAGTSASVVFDVLPHNERDADALAQQLAALVPLPASDLYGGDVSGVHRRPPRDGRHPLLGDCRLLRLL